METLLNFRIPTDLKHRFQVLCAERKSNMTAEINRFILEYVGIPPTSKPTRSTTWCVQGGQHAR